MTAQIDHLFNHPEHRSLVAGWIYHEFWRDRPGYSVAMFEELLRKADDPDRIPLSLLALVDGQPAGTVNLVHNDDESRPHLHPWLAALVVTPERRGSGVGSALVRRLLCDARRLGVTDLYLGADIPDFYARLGAVRHERASDSLWIMRIPLDVG